MKDMQRTYFLMAAVAIALVAAGCAIEVVEAPEVEIIMDPDAPITEAPASYGIGSTWVFNHTLNGETVQMTSTLIDRVQRKGREVYVISNAVAYRDPGAPCDGSDGWLFDVETDGFVACTKNGDILSSNTPYHGRFNWPLEVGKSWRTKYFWTDKVIHPDWSGPGWQDWTVVAWEEVTVPAGTFMAYKVMRTKGNWETSTEDVDIQWYAPELQTAIKSVWHRSPNDGYGGAEHMWELVSADLM